MSHLSWEREKENSEQKSDLTKFEYFCDLDGAAAPGVFSSLHSELEEGGGCSILCFLGQTLFHFSARIILNPHQVI